MKAIIEKIRKQPKSVRKQIILGITIVITGIIFLFWVYTLPYRFANKNGGGIKADLKPFQLLGESISDSFSNISDVVKKK